MCYIYKHLYIYINIYLTINMFIMFMCQLFNMFRYN